MTDRSIWRYDGEKIGDVMENTQHLIGKTAKQIAVFSGNVVDTTGKKAPASTLDGTIHFDLPDGVYFSNPWATDTGKSILMYPKDSDGNAINMILESDQGSRSYIECTNVYLIRIIVEGLKIQLHGYNSQIAYNVDNRIQNRVYILEKTPAYWEFRGGGYTQGEDIDRGFTQNSFNTLYVPYSVPTVDYVYTEELDNHIEAYSDGIKNAIFEKSENLLDYSKIIWTDEGGYYPLPRDYYIPVSAGDVIETNITQGYFDFFDSQYSKISRAGFSVTYLPITVPENAEWLRFYISSGYTTEGDEIMIWKARSAISAKYERPIYRPSIRFNPKYADGNMFDYAVPTSPAQGVVRMARYAALQAANERQNAYRFATYNTYVSRGDKGFHIIREMALDYALDFIGMQECDYPGTTVQSAMYQFQFPYGTPEMHVDESQRDIPVPSVSRFEITSVKDILLEESRHCLRVTMNFPRHKHYPRVATLSVYNYHGSLSKANRLAEIQTMLAEIANDTADFKIIMGDTNSEVDQQGHRQSWDAWEAAGFTAVHHGESPTWPSVENPSNYSSMDNIFVSEHINVLGYNIVPWQNYLLPGNLSLSDHDLVYADLQFDFDAVLKNTWEEPRTVT